MTTTALLEGGPLGAVEVADRFGVAHTTVWRWATTLGLGGKGSGCQIWLTPTEVLICRAWQMISERHSHEPHLAPHRGLLYDYAAAAQRRRPGPWLAVCDRGGFTAATAEDATQVAQALSWPSWWLVDCQVPE